MRTLVAAIIGVLGLAFTTSVVAAPSPRLDYGAMLNHSQCPAGRLVINITETVLNDADSGEAGNYWAMDDVVRHIQVVQVAPNTFCATVKYDGLFNTVQGTSPGATGMVGDGVHGT